MFFPQHDTSVAVESCLNCGNPYDDHAAGTACRRCSAARPPEERGPQNESPLLAQAASVRYMWRFDTDGMYNVKLLVPQCVTELQALADALGHALYHNGEAPQNTSGQHLLILIFIFGMYAAKAAKLPCIIGQHLSQAIVMTDMSSGLLQLAASQTFLDVLPCPPPPAFLEFVDKCLVVAEIAALTQWKCHLCGLSSAKFDVVCKHCGAPKVNNADTLGPVTDLVRMPSDMDASFFAPPVSV